jgi:uncharacterized protein YbcC (UPF0753/DUF2309 family)
MDVLDHIETPVEPAFDWDAAIASATARIAPLWPLKHFVAVNPFLGFSAQSFASACASLQRVTGVSMLAPRAFYAQALQQGDVQPQDLEAALAAAPPERRPLGGVEDLRQAAFRTAQPRPRPSATVATVAETLDKLASGDRQASRTAFMIDEIAKFCAAYFDQGQSVWRLPSRDLPLYAAWRQAMRYDRNPEAMGVSGFRDAVARAPADPRAAIRLVVEELGIPERAVVDYLHRALFDIGGWAAYARYLGWTGENDDALVELLAIRVVWGFALFLERADEPFRAAWRRAMLEAANAPQDEALGNDPELAVDLTLHEAYEHAFRRRFLPRLKPAPAPAPARPALQAAFCIDVRSEIFRRALESVWPEAETIGFAGFFGFPIEYVPLGASRGGAQCPVLLKPAVIVCESVDGADEEEEASLLGLRLLRRRAAKGWKAFKLSAISCFGFVETAGLGYAAKLVGDSLGWTRPVVDPRNDGLDTATQARMKPRIAPREVAGRATGFAAPARVDMAEAALKAMSMTSNFAPLVLLAGHGSTSANNPHATGLDCGACGGHTGEANARVAAALLNDESVRAGLAARGIAIPHDTWFVAALHDTTSDEVRLFDADRAPVSHKQRMADLKARLAQAAKLARAERAPALGAKTADALPARGRDWSQVRPEWGLANNAAFIAAPRALTRGLDLQGRSFLHSYDWRQDKDGRVLNLILTAPLVVASWINLQYFGSSVNNRAFGAGAKTLHNVVGALGVIEGASGDLRVGLPMQSVHNGERLMHEPVRLHAFVAAPREMMSCVIADSQTLRELVDNNWVHLFALDDDGRPTHTYAGAMTWRALS